MNLRRKGVTAMLEISVGQAVAAFIAAMCIPSALTGFIVWNFERKITARDKKRDAEEQARQKKTAEREQAREELELVMIEGTNAAIALAEATAKAVQRIPDAHCNGDMHDALAYAASVKHKQKNFLAKQGVKAVVV